MPTNMVYIEDLHIDSVNWTARVMVMEKNIPRPTAKTGRPYQRLMFQDEKVNIN